MPTARQHCRRPSDIVASRAYRLGAHVQLAPTRRTSWALTGSSRAGVERGGAIGRVRRKNGTGLRRSLGSLETAQGDRPVAADTGVASMRLAAERRGAGGPPVTGADWRGAHSIAQRLLRRAPLCLVVRQEPIELLGTLRIDAHLAATGIAQRSRSDSGAGPRHLRVADPCGGNGGTVSGAQCCAIGGCAAGDDRNEQRCHRQRNPQRSQPWL